MNILITGAWNNWEPSRKALEAMGHHISFLQQEKDALPVACDWVEGVICNGLFLHHEADLFPNLRYVQLTSAGFDRIPADQLRARGVHLYNARGVYSVPMAESALAGVLQLYKQSRFFTENQRMHQWEKHRGLLELAGKTVCILGCGSVGTECAKRFQAFGCRVIGIDLYPAENPCYSQMLHLDALDTILPQADIAVLTLPLTEQTRHLINADRLAAMRPGAILVNIARGAVADTEALIHALEDHLGGAVLDVFETEPLQENSPLWDMENVILTPHNSFVGEGNNARLAELILENLETDT